MASKKATSNSNTDNPIQVLKKGTCPTSSGNSTLGYEVGIDDSKAIFIQVSANDGGGFWSREWLNFTDIQEALAAWPKDQGITSMALRRLFRGKSANTPGFLIAVLCAEGILEPMPKRKRVHQACDPALFVASIQGLQKATKKKPTPKAKAKAAPKAKAKRPPARTAKTAKTPRKSPAASRKKK